jgi:hypothetical protein
LDIVAAGAVTPASPIDERTGTFMDHQRRPPTLQVHRAPDVDLVDLPARIEDRTIRRTFDMTADPGKAAPVRIDPPPPRKPLC